MRRPFEFMRLRETVRFREDDVPEECVPSVRGPECAVRHEGLVSLCRGFDIALRTPLSLYSMGPSSSLVFRGKVYFFPTPGERKKREGKRAPSLAGPSHSPEERDARRGFCPSLPPRWTPPSLVRLAFPCFRMYKTNFLYPQKYSSTARSKACSWETRGQNSI